MTLAATLAMAPRTRSTEKRPRHRRSATLPTRLPNISTKSTLSTPIISDLNPVTRINILHPPSISRRTVFLETKEAQYHMQRRSALMQQQQWMREHGEWQKPIYGTAAVKEDYKSRLRSTLKSQMEDRQKLRQKEWGDAVNETVMMSERDHRDCMADADKRKKRHEFLTAFTKANKEMMESKWQQQRKQKMIENKRDSEQLKYNPINWSHTMK